MVQDFILEAKNNFSGSETNFSRLPMPLGAIEEDKERGIQDGEIEITAAHMKEMFSFSVKRACELILQQIQQTQHLSKFKLKYVFMVGGFSESPYVYKTIKAFAEGYGLRVIRPAHAWSAVVRGAAAKGFEGPGRAPILARKCRRYYGVYCSIDFICRKHNEDDSYQCPYTGMKQVGNQVEWLLRTRQDLSAQADSHAQSRFETYFWLDQSRKHSLFLAASDSPIYSKDKHMYTVAELTVDLSDVPEDEFTLYVNSWGKMYHMLEFHVQVSVQSALEYSLLVNRVRYGTVTVEYT